MRIIKLVNGASSPVPKPMSAAKHVGNGTKFITKPRVAASRNVDGAANRSRSEAQDKCDGSPIDTLLMIAADSLDDIEKLRISLKNRLESLERVKGQVDAPEYELLEALLANAEAMEAHAIKALEAMAKMHPLVGWIKQTKGVGMKQGARLLAALGDPLVNEAEDRPRRGLAELWQYAGHGDPARSRRRKGEKVQFNPAVKMRLHLIAESCIKSRCTACKEASEGNGWAAPPADCTCPDTHRFRAYFDDARMAWDERDTTDGHKHNHAMKIVGKELLRDLWIYASDN